MLILIADADAERRGIVRSALTRFGYRYQEAATGSDAWDAVCTGQPEIVLAWLHLPDDSGLTLATRLRNLQRTRPCYVVAVAEAADPQSTRAAMESGADDVLVSPFDDEQLHARIQVAERHLLQAARIGELEHGLERARAALRATARTDALTNLWNRVQLTDDLELFRGQLQRYGHRYAVAILNLDRFRIYNDAHGQLAGDEVLRLIARTVARVLRTGDRAYRYGGDEMIVLLPEQTPASAYIAAGRLRDAVEALTVPHPGNPPDGVVTVSVGVAAFPPGDQESTYEALIRRAEGALLRAKADGGNQVMLDDSSVG